MNVNLIEKSIIRAIIENPKIVGEMQILLSAEDFSSPYVANIYQLSLNQIHKDSIEKHYLYSHSDNGQTKILDEIYAISIDDAKPNFRKYCKVVLDNSIRKNLLKSSEEFVKELRVTKDLEKIIGKFESAIYHSTRKQTKPVVKVGDFANNHFERIKKKKEQRDIHGSVSIEMPTGFESLDRMTLGFNRGDMWLLGGSTNDGKTELALQMACYLANQNVPVLFFSAEMNKVTLLNRILAMLSLVSHSAIRSGDLTNEQLEAIKATAEALKNVPLYIDDTPSPSTSTMISRAKWLKVFEENLGLVVVDYLQLCHTAERDTRELTIAQIGRDLLYLARELNLSVLIVSQLNTGSEEGTTRRPRLIDVRESKAPTHDASVVLLLHLPNKYKEDKNFERETTELIIAKNRHGEVRNINLKNNLTLQYFEEVFRQETSFAKT